MNKIAVALLFAVALVGCVAPQPIRPAARQVAFNESEYAPYSGKGTGRVIGSAFLKTRGGDVKLGAGCTVVLNPVTGASTEFFRRAVVNGEHLQAGDPRAMNYTRMSVADAAGAFEFNDLPAGNYYLHCEIWWEVPTQYGISRSGGVAHAIVSVVDRETVKVVLTR